MADGFDIHLDHEQAERLKAAADMVGMSPADFAVLLIDAGLPARVIDPDPAIDHAIIEEAIRTGDTVPWSEVQARLRRFGGREG
jgi:hypothetical protein